MWDIVAGKHHFLKMITKCLKFRKPSVMLEFTKENYHYQSWLG